MSIQSITERSIETVFNSTFKELEKEAYKYWTNKYYLIGEANYKKIEHSFLIIDTICTDNCELIDFIEKKLSGKLDLPKRKTSKVRKVEYEIDCIGEIMDDSDTECCDWKEIEW